MPLNSILALVNSCKTAAQFYRLHAVVIRSGLEQDHVLSGRLLQLSSQVLYSASIFDRVLTPNTFLYNIIIRDFSRSSHFNDTVSLFIRMKRSGHAFPDNYTYPPLIKSCLSECRLKECEIFHGSALRCGVCDDPYVGLSLIDFYGKCKEVVSARKVFDEMTQRNVFCWTSMVNGYANVGDLCNAMVLFDQMPERNLASWNAMIGGLVKAGDLIRAKRLFDKMPEKDVVSFTALIDGYSKAGDMASARALFEQAPRRDIVAWSALISGYAQNGQPNEAVKVFQMMEVMNVKPDEYILVSLMSACSQLGSLDLAKWIDNYLSGSSIDTARSHVIAALIDMNAKCGNMDRAEKLFEEMPRRDLFTYCSMVQGFSIHGHALQAVALFNRMLNEGLVPDKVAFTVILTACSRGGLIEEGLHYFETMATKYSIVPSSDHYACVVDLLSRAGRLKEANELLTSMPVEPDTSALGALLAACKRLGNVELGQVVANKLFELEPQSAGAYVVLSDIYAARNQWDDVSFVRDTMKERGIRKVPGQSWVENDTQKSLG